MQTRNVEGGEDQCPDKKRECAVVTGNDTQDEDPLVREHFIRPLM